MDTSKCERLINKLMAKHGAPTAAQTHLNLELKSMMDKSALDGLHPEVIGFLFMQHATAYLAALKITGQARAELCDALAEDCRDSVVNRARTGFFSGLKPPGG